MIDPLIQEFVNFINSNCVGKTIAGAIPQEDAFIPCVVIMFTDGTAVKVTGEHDEGVCVDDYFPS